MLLCLFMKKKTGRVFPAFCHTTFHHACILRGIHCLMYHDRDTFDFNQGHVAKNQLMAVPV